MAKASYKSKKSVRKKLTPQQRKMKTASKKCKKKGNYIKCMKRELKK